MAVLAAQVFAPVWAGAAVHEPRAIGTGWRLDDAIAFRGQMVLLDSIHVTSADDAWVAGLVIADNYSAEKLLIERWNGAAWRPSAVPAREARRFAAQTPFVQIGASSPRNVWAVALTGGRYLRFDGTRWSAGALPRPKAGTLAIYSVEVFGRADVWVIGGVLHLAGSRAEFAPYAVRFNGRRWTRMPVPGRGVLAAVSALSGRDIWAVLATGSASADRGPAPVILRWNGTAWRPAAQPKLPEHATVNGILATATDDVWIVGGRPHGSKGTSGLAMHWNGKSWRPASPATAAPAKAYALSSPAPDGSGGFWALGNPLSFSPARLWHHAGRSWVGPEPVPGYLAQLAAVPGTKSTWAIGENAAFDNGLILVHGPLPH